MPNTSVQSFKVDSIYKAPGGVGGGGGGGGGGGTKPVRIVQVS